MKNYIIIFICLISLSNLSFSQKRYVILKQRRVHFWSFSIDGGVIVPVGDFGNAYKTSGNAGIELAFNPNPSFCVFVDGQYNFLSNIDTNYSARSSIIETTIGGRAYMGKGMAKFFVEASFGDYILRTNYNDPYYGPTTISNSNFGLSGGIGGDMEVSRRMTVFIKSKYHTIFTNGGNTNYIGQYGGIRFII